MKRPFAVVLAGILATLAGGCSTIPPGFTRAEWNTLTPQQQAREIDLARRQDLPGFKSNMATARSEADSTISRLSPAQSTLSPNPSSTR